MLVQDVISEIGRYLDIKDVLNCSLVNKTWRNGLNDNRIWKRFVHERFDMSVDKSRETILKQTCMVMPPFEIPENKGEGMDDVCSWRIRFAQEMRILRNFTRGHYAYEEVDETFVDKIISSNVIPSPGSASKTFVCDDDHFVLLCDEKNQFDIWSQWPTFQKLDPIKFALGDQVVKFFALFSHGFVYLQQRLLVVYNKTDENAFKLKMRVIVDDDPKFRVPDNDDLTSWYPTNAKKPKNFISFFYDDGYCVADFRTKNDLQMHIWDLYTGTKQTRQVDIKIELNQAELHCRFIKGSMIFFYTLKKSLLFHKVFSLDLNNPASGVQTFFHDQTIQSPCFHRMYLCYVRIGTNYIENRLETCNLVTKKIKSTVINDLMSIEPISPFHVAGVLFKEFVLTGGIMVNIYDIESLELRGESIARCELQERIYVAPHIFVTFSGKVYQEPEAEDIENRVRAFSSFSLQYFISRTKILDLISRKNYYFW